MASWPCYPSPFPQNEELRTHVKYMALKAMNKLNEETLMPLEANERSIQLLEQVSNEPPLKDFLLQFFFPSVDNEIIEVQAQVLFQLSGEVSDRVSFTTKSIRFNWHNL